MPVNEAILGFQEEGWKLLPSSENYSSFLERLSNMEEWTFAQDFHIPELLVFPPGTAFFDHPGYKTGEIILQDKVLIKTRYSSFYFYIQRVLNKNVFLGKLFPSFSLESTYRIYGFRYVLSSRNENYAFGCNFTKSRVNIENILYNMK